MYGSLNCIPEDCSPTIVQTCCSFISERKWQFLSKMKIYGLIYVYIGQFICENIYFVVGPAPQGITEEKERSQMVLGNVQIRQTCQYINRRQDLCHFGL